MFRRWIRFAQFMGLAWLSLAASLAAAHEFKLDALMTAFVKVERSQAHLVIRVPLYLFKSVRFPVKGNEIDVPNASAALGRALIAIESDVLLYEDGRPLTAAGGIARLALPSDRSFERYDQASAHVAEPIAPDTGSYIDQGYVDADIVDSIQSPQPEFSVRTNAGPEFA